MKNITFMGNGITYRMGAERKLSGIRMNFTPGTQDERRRLYEQSDIEGMISEIKAKGTIPLDGESIVVQPDQVEFLARYLERL